MCDLSNIDDSNLRVLQGIFNVFITKIWQSCIIHLDFKATRFASENAQQELKFYTRVLVKISSPEIWLCRKLHYKSKKISSHCDFFCLLHHICGFRQEV